jgi:glucose-6-phosphate isomerase
MKQIIYDDAFSKAAEGYGSYRDAVRTISEKLCRHSYGMDGFIDYPVKAGAAFLNEIQAAADEIIKNNEALVVLGIGGSYLGAKALIEMLGNPSRTKILFGGCNLSSDYHLKILDERKDKSFPF